MDFSRGPRSLVALAACSDYDRGRVFQAVARAVDLLGPDALPDPSTLDGKPLLLKPNMLRPAPAVRGVTTHPAVFFAVARLLKERGYSLTFGDSPNGMFSSLSVARQSGLLETASELGVPLADFDDGEDVSHPEGVRNRRFRIARGVLEASALINLPRLKTHGLTTMTGALKNVFGAVPGGLKSEYHITHPDVESFSQMIADLNGLIPSRLVVMDAITAMEGNGPANGSLRNLGLLIVSTDPVAVDAVGCRLVGIDPLTVDHVRMAEEAGLGNAHKDMIEIVGESLDPHRSPDFDVRARPLGRNVPRFVMRWAKSLVVSKPVIDPSACICCGQCTEACPTTPASVVQVNHGFPRYDYSTCIRCYCCQETCPQGAISIKAAPLSRLFENRR